MLPPTLPKMRLLPKLPKLYQQFFEHVMAQKINPKADELNDGPMPSCTWCVASAEPAPVDQLAKDESKSHKRKLYDLPLHDNSNFVDVALDSVTYASQAHPVASEGS